MSGNSEARFRGTQGGALALGRVVLAAATLTGCSSVPDALNPVEWYKGVETVFTSTPEPQVATPRGAPQTANAEAPAETAKKEPAKGLVADRSNSKYAEPVRREVAPTRQLAKRTPPPAEQTQVAKAAEAPTAAQAQAKDTAAAVPPKPAVTAQPLPPAAPAPQTAQAAKHPELSLDRRQPTARDVGGGTPPDQLAAAPPPRPDIPDVVPLPNQAKGARLPRALDDQYKRRLAESAPAIARPDPFESVPAALPASYAPGEEPIRLIPPGKRKTGGRGKLSAPVEVPSAASSFQVASVDFQGGGARLTKQDHRAIAQVAKLYRKTGGTVRVLGTAPEPSYRLYASTVQDMMGRFEASMDRANAVARELARRGVPSSKIMVGADPGAASGSGAQVFLEY